MQIGRSCFLRNAELYLGIHTGTLDCIVKLPEKMCTSHTNPLTENKKVFNSSS